MSILRDDYDDLRWFVFAVPFIILMVFLFISIPAENNKNRKLCEDSGGIFYQASTQADNCVFPPKDTK